MKIYFPFFFHFLHLLNIYFVFYSSERTLMNILKSMIGPGCLALPLAFKYCGLWVRINFVGKIWKIWILKKLKFKDGPRSNIYHRFAEYLLHGNFGEMRPIFVQSQWKNWTGLRSHGKKSVWFWWRKNSNAQQNRSLCHKCRHLHLSTRRLQRSIRFYGRKFAKSFSFFVSFLLKKNSKF